MRRTLPLLILAGALSAGAVTASAESDKPRGSVSVGGAAFLDDTGDEDCRVGRAAYSFFLADAEAGDEDCDLVAGIQLPDGADLKSMRCGLFDSSAAGGMEAYLVRVELATGEPEYVFVTAGTVDSGIVQLLGDDAAEAGTGRVDNAKFAYYLAAAFSGTDFTAVGNDMRVYGCTVSYR